MSWYLEVLKKYAVFGGRARRKEFWMFYLFNIIIMAVLYIVYFATRLNGAVMAIVTIYSLAIILPSLAVAMRRLHDTGKSGWFIFIALIPLVGEIILIVFLCVDSQPGDNQYGSYPK